MKIYNKTLGQTQLRKRIGNMDQVAGVRIVQLDDGNERPVRAAQFKTGTGLEFTVLLDRGMDIPSASYCGRAMGWRSTTGDVAPQYFEAEGIRWLRSYFGGMLTTCGLTNVGGPAPDSAVSGRGLHGRISHAPARNLQVRQEWDQEEYVLSVKGEMRETALFSEKLSLTRTVSTKLGEKRFWIHDEIRNDGFNDTPFMVLYHCNVGWPAVEAGSRVLAPSRHIAPIGDFAKQDQARWNQLDAPAHGIDEKCYYHDMKPAKDGTVVTAIVNDRFGDGEGFGVYVKYNTNQLPRFTQWKMMGEQDYVVGLEPCNCGVTGRQVDEDNGLLHVLKPGEVRCVDLEFGPIATAEELKAIEKVSGGATPRFVDSCLKFVPKP
ncbi:MAG: aldose 1-epimerase family protein [Candidatus Hydrogenedentes bacterium]|nr:aldose 1-epimerase family protein [Candidatus Hydrogenedentota bacterium]